MTLKETFAAANKPNLRCAASALLALLLVTFNPTRSMGYASFATGTKHDFTASAGYTGGSVCGECHNAGGGALGDGTRLLVKFSDNTALTGDSAGDNVVAPTFTCSKTCHIQNATSASINPPQASSGGWASETTAESYIFSKPMISSAPPHTVSCTGGKFLACEQCHPRTDFSRCLDCHADTAVDTYFCGQGAGTDSDYDLAVSKFFVGMSGAAGLGILSSHNITYSTLPSADMTDPANNECLKCHGTSAATDHPGRASNGTGLMTPLLFLAGSAQTPVTQPTTTGAPEWNAFNRLKRQDFCLSCHDGLYDADSASDNIRFGGQPVPAVPKYNYNSGAPNFASGTPYFANVGELNFATKTYYINNGHGAPTASRTGTAMNLTCMGETNVRPGDASNDASPGCHSAHGTKNFSTLRDSGAYRDPFISGIDNPEEMSQFCQLCHNRNTFSVFPMSNGFHAGIMNNGQLSHFDSRAYQTQDTFDNGNTVFWRMNTVNMKTGDPAVNQIQPMPFFNSKTAANTLRDGRLHSNTPGPGSDKRRFDPAGSSTSSTGSVITCITCHDPHGTFDSMMERTTDNTFGMLRYPEGIDGDSYSWELCAQCHKP